MNYFTGMRDLRTHTYTYIHLINQVTWYDGLDLWCLVQQVSIPKGQ